LDTAFWFSQCSPNSFAAELQENFNDNASNRTFAFLSASSVGISHGVIV
jgi:hypothetical protein